MKAWEVIVSLTNAMIGSLILILPLLTVQGGSIMTPLVIILTGIFSYYSCYICVAHLGNHQDLDKAIFYHFNKSKVIRIAYDFMVFLSILFLIILYFNLICIQWQGLFQKHLAIPLSNMFALFGLVIFLNYFHLGPKLLAYGLLSILAYLIFLIWMLASTPSGPNTLPLFGNDAVSMASSMGQAYTIQSIFIPILRQLPDTKNYRKYTLYTYLIGGSIYMYIAYMGAFGILNRTAYQTPPQTIQSYFQPDDPQVAALQVVYLVHLYSAYGQFLLVAKKRFFGMFSVTNLSKQGQMLKLHQIFFTALIIGICCAIFLTNFSIDDLITINGGVIGFFFIYLMPSVMHLKCLYCCQKQKQGQAQTQTIQMEAQSNPVHKDIRQLQAHLNTLEKNSQKQSQNNEQKTAEQQVVDLTCPCVKPKLWIQVVDIVTMVGMVALGAFIMVDGIYTVIQG